MGSHQRLPSSMLQKLSVLYYLQSLCPVPAPTDSNMPALMKLLLAPAAPASHAGRHLRHSCCNGPGPLRRLSRDSPHGSQLQHGIDRSDRHNFNPVSVLALKEGPKWPLNSIWATFFAFNLHFYPGGEIWRVFPKSKKS